MSMIRKSFRAVYNKTPQAIAFCTTALTVGAASAGDLATAVTGALDASEMTLIGVGVLALTGVVVLIKKAQRAAGG